MQGNRRKAGPRPIRAPGPQTPIKKPVGYYWQRRHWPCYPDWYHTWDDYNYDYDYYDNYDYDYDYNNYDDWYETVYTSAYEKGVKEGRQQGYAHAVKLRQSAMGNCSPEHTTVMPTPEPDVANVAPLATTTLGI